MSVTVQFPSIADVFGATDWQRRSVGLVQLLLMFPAAHDRQFEPLKLNLNKFIYVLNYTGRRNKHRARGGSSLPRGAGAGGTYKNKSVEQ